MPIFPSKLPFASFLQYRPKGEEPVAVQSRNVTYSIKQDKFMNIGGRDVRVIDYAAKRIAGLLGDFPFLNQYFGPNVVLVPAPRSSPLKPGALWPALRICEALVAVGLGDRVEACLERRQGIVKSATAAPGERPGPQEHYDSIGVRQQQSLHAVNAVTVIDDVITRGATFVGVMPHLESFFPGVPIRCFAMVRTMSYGEIQQLREPVEGTITFEHGRLRREP
jgi:hypothetical protein